MTTRFATALKTGEKSFDVGQACARSALEKLDGADTSLCVVLSWAPMR